MSNTIQHTKAGKAPKTGVPNQHGPHLTYITVNECVIMLRQISCKFLLQNCRLNSSLQVNIYREN